MLWGIQRHSWPRVVTALAVALIVTIASVRLFMAGAPRGNDAALAASRLLTQSAGEIDPDYAQEPVVVRPAPDPIVITLTVDRNASITSYLEEAGMGPAEADRWAASFASVAYSRSLSRGHALTLYKDPEDGSLRGLKYNFDDRIAFHERSYGDDVIRMSQELITYVIRPVAVSFKLSGDFNRDAARHDLPRPIVATLRNAFDDRHPLNRLPRGSDVKLIYQERVSRDGTDREVTGLEAAQIHFGDKTLSAFAFRDANGEAHLYDADGEALEPESLRFPCKFNYISSGFTFHRYHPILHEYRPHVGVDLATHYGTPVMAVADGSVEQAGWCGELGRCVRIDHHDGLVSIYGHLSAIAPDLRRGESVRVGEMIGRVGSSGLSTGPHLHFAIEKDGRYVNPLTASLGVHNHVSPRMRAMFDRFKRDYLAALDHVPSFGGHFNVGHDGSTAFARGGAGATRPVADSGGNAAHAGPIRTVAAGSLTR